MNWKIDDLFSIAVQAEEIVLLPWHPEDPKVEVYFNILGVIQLLANALLETIRIKSKVWRQSECTANLCHTGGNFLEVYFLAFYKY